MSMSHRVCENCNKRGVSLKFIIITANITRMYCTLKCMKKWIKKSWKL